MYIFSKLNKIVIIKKYIIIIIIISIIFIIIIIIIIEDWKRIEDLKKYRGLVGKDAPLC